MKRRTDFWADWTGKQGERGEWTGEHKLRKMMEKRAQMTWETAMEREGGQQAWINDWGSENIQTKCNWICDDGQLGNTLIQWNENERGKKIWWVAGAPDSQPPEILMNVRTEGHPAYIKTFLLLPGLVIQRNRSALTESTAEQIHIASYCSTIRCQDQCYDIASFTGGAVCATSMGDEDYHQGCFHGIRNNLYYNRELNSRLVFL